MVNMFHDPFGWFPSDVFSTILGCLALLVFVGDELIGRYLNRKKPHSPQKSGDRYSFILILVAEYVALGVGIACRYFNFGTLTGLAQYLGLAILAGGFFIRAWAMLRLGRFFSRVVEIESGHQLIKDGPYRWFRHPAYTGMVTIFLGLNLALGSWVGALAGLAILLAATYYRIRVEEQVLLEQFGEEYRAYAQQTWMIFPGF